MQAIHRSISIGSALLAATLLAACGGGSPQGTLPSTTGAPILHNQKSGSYLTVVINRAKSMKGHQRQFVSSSAAGLQVTVALTASSATPQMVFADISSNSPLCSTNGTTQTCTIAIPTLGSAETISAMELDQTPIQDTNGYGTGFQQGANGPNILAEGSATTNITLGSAANNISLSLDPVASRLADGGATTAGLNFNEDPNVSMRLVATGATVMPAQGLAVYGLDATGQNIKREATPLPYVDVNGAPEPISIAVSPQASGVVVNALQPSSPVPPFGTSASIPDETMVWPGYEWVIDVEGGATFTSPATITISNSLSALNPFTGNSYASSLIYTIDPVTVSTPTLQSISLGAAQTSSVVGSDPQAPAAGMGAESAFQANDGMCVDQNTPGQHDASVAPAGSFNTTTSTQSFTITPLATGTCTFVLYDVDTGVVTQPATITVTP